MSFIIRQRSRFLFRFLASRFLFFPISRRTGSSIFCIAKVLGSREEVLRSDGPNVHRHRSKKVTLDDAGRKLRRRLACVFAGVAAFRLGSCSRWRSLLRRLAGAQNHHENLLERRCTRSVDQMVDGMTIMANGIKAGQSLTQSMERVVENINGPLVARIRSGAEQNSSRVCRSKKHSTNSANAFRAKTCRCL